MTLETILTKTFRYATILLAGMSIGFVLRGHVNGKWITQAYERDQQSVILHVLENGNFEEASR